MTHVSSPWMCWANFRLALSWCWCCLASMDRRQQCLAHAFGAWTEEDFFRLQVIHDWCMKSNTCFDNGTIFTNLFICICNNWISSSPNLFGNMAYSKKLNCIFHHKNTIFLLLLIVRLKTFCACQFHCQILSHINIWW